MSAVCKLQYCLDNWKKYTSDPWILQTISGYYLEFETRPFQNSIPGEIKFSDEQRQIINNEVSDLLEKGAIQHSNWEEKQFISNIFIVPKPNGKYRPIINLKYLNQFMKYEHFKQETFKMVLGLIQEQDFFTSIDLQNAYFSVPINKQFYRFLKFIWNGELWHFICLPFGLSSAPRVFTKILKPIYAWFRQQAIRCSYYIDDSLNMDQNYQVCLKNAKSMVAVLESLGFTINKQKSVLIPTQTITFFGFELDSVRFLVILPEVKVQKIKKFAKWLLQENVITVRVLASFIGLVLNAFYAILEGPLHYRSLERDKILSLCGTLDFGNTLVLSEHSRIDLQWWAYDFDKKNGKRIRPQKVEITCRTDASLAGWGAYDVSSEKSANGRWSLNELGFSINYLELLAVWFALQTLYSDISNKHIEIQCDNVSAVKYVNDFGGMTSHDMDSLASKIWNWCINKNIFISAVHISGVSNVQADFLSRNFSDCTEWQLKRQIFDRLCKQCFLPDIDLFASRLNRQLDKFVSWFPEVGAYRNDAFSFSWHSFSPYIFCPFNLVGRVVTKIIADGVNKALLIIPHWKSQLWFPMVVANLICFPIRLPRHADLLRLPHNNQTHPMSKRLRMVAVVLSGNSSKVEEFRSQLQTSLPAHGETELGNNMTLLGKSGIFGAYADIPIPLLQLKR